MLSAGAATTLAVLHGRGRDGRAGRRGSCSCRAGWWVAAALIGAYLGRKDEVNPPIGRLLADAKTATMMPEHRPGAVLINRLWPLLRRP